MIKAVIFDMFETGEKVEKVVFNSPCDLTHKSEHDAVEPEAE